MIKTKLCGICGEEFQPVQKAQKYCGVKCRRKADKIRIHEKWIREKEKQRKKQAKVPSESISYIARIAKECGLTYGQ